MGAGENYDWRAAAASALEWWADAGVDVLVDDAPRDWLAPVAPAVAPAPLVAAPAALPETLAAFLAWRIGADVPEHGWPTRMLPAEGPLDARLMVLIDAPARDDHGEGRLMTGAAGKLFDRMLAAIGFARDQVHLACVCAARPAGGRMGRDDEARLGELARHHAALAAPERLLVLGDAASRAILGTGVDEARGRLHPLNHRDRTTGAVASFHPRLLLEKPALKAKAWGDLQVMIGGWR